MERSPKPLGRKAYGSIPHLPNSRLGPGDWSIHEGQARILTEKTRDYRDIVIVTQKIDGSCVSVAKLDDGKIVALTRAGYLAETSPYRQHHLFSFWVARNILRFQELLFPGERVVGEWIAQAHGTIYNLRHEPFVAFDMMVESERLPWLDTFSRLSRLNFVTPQLVSYGQAISIEDVIKRLQNVHGAETIFEGAVWRVERDDICDFLAKWVDPRKEDGIFLGEIEVWNKNLDMWLK